MLIGETILVALQAIRANALRSVLTALGIIIGVAAVITMVALGAGAQRAVEEQIEAMGANVLSVFPGMQFTRGVATNTRVNLTTDDAEALQTRAELLSGVIPEMRDACPRERGRTRESFSITSLERPAIPS